MPQARHMSRLITADLSTCWPPAPPIHPLFVSHPPRPTRLSLCLPCRQLYAGIAELVGQATDAPEEVLLLSQFNTSTGDSAVYDDLKV